MNPRYLIPIFLIFLLTFSLTSGEALSYDELNFDDYEERQDSQSKISNTVTSNTDVYDEVRELHRRSLFSTSRASQTRQEIIDILRKAYNQGWKPNLKHYMPGTRFGRHHR